MVVTHSLSESELKKLKTKFHFRNLNHTYKSNNWLKRHHEPMRRKPFKREYAILDEGHFLYG